MTASSPGASTGGMVTVDRVGTVDRMVPASTRVDTADRAAPARAPATVGTASTARPVPGPVVLVGTGGLTWADIGENTPVLRSHLGTAALGSIAVRSLSPATCPVDGWLAVSAGRRAADSPPGTNEPTCRAPELYGTAMGGQAAVPRWDTYVREAERASFDAEPGLLGSTLARAGRSSVAVGPGAVIALATPVPLDDTEALDASGSRDDDWPGRPATAIVARTYPGAGGGPDLPLDDTGAEALRRDVRAALALDPDLLVVDAGAVRDPAAQHSGRHAPTGAWATPVAVQLRALDARLGAVLAELPGDATVLVASIADAGSDPHLQVLLASGPAPGSGSASGAGPTPVAGSASGTASARGGSRYASSLLGASSTRQDGLVQTTDLLPTLLEALGVAVPDAAVGAVVRPVRTGTPGSAAARLERVRDLDQAAQAVRPAVPWFFNGFVVGQILLYGLATLALRRRGASPNRGAVLRVLRCGAVVFASVPAATFLANLLPWWRTEHPGWAVTGAVALFTVPIAALALLGPWRRTLLGELGVVGGVTAAVLAVDVITGSHLVLSSLMGVQPVVAGRFYGFSNPGFALFATGTLLLAVAAADVLIRRGRRLLAVGTVTGVGLVATVIDGMPGLGSDFGGPPAIIPAFAVLALLVAGVRVTWRRALLIAGATLAVIVTLSVLDWVRPPGDRTHLGRFVQTVLDGGAWPVIQRKAMQNLDILTKPIALPLPFAIAFVAFVLARPVAWGVRPLQLAYDRSPVLRQGLASFAVLMAIGFALNDSGAAIPAVAATVAIPLLIAVSVRAMEETPAVADETPEAADEPPATADEPSPAP